ncbi:UTP--glucose-1-phosphate uridylyltransferase [Candidatus Saccharibacteria bacterium]|nr:UTP--glucose-1-phosphate uridylyltransferase [Candidatus Saccharibacteria bacterium]
MPVRKAVIAAAGFGTRFLPQTKALPKEMLPLVDKPIIQYIVEELVDAGIEDIVIVTGYHKRSIEDHFDNISGDLRTNLEQGNKHDLLKDIQKISNLANFAYIRQKGRYGSATPVLNAEHLIGNEPFIYTYADDFIVASPSRFKQMVDLYQKTGNSVLTCIEVIKDVDYKRYGIVAGNEIEPGILNMSTIVEKPGKENAPSNLASVSGYLFTPDIFQHIHNEAKEYNGDSEFYIQPAMQRLIKSCKQILAYKVKGGRYYDTGNKLEYLKTVVDFALKHDDIKADFAEYLKQLVSGNTLH